MSPFLQSSTRFLHEPVGARPRLLLTIAAVLLVGTYVFPLWNLTMFAPQYANGLTLDIHSYTLVGGNRGHDIKEINLLNHYIGMAPLAAEDFTEFKWMPFVLGALSLVFLRAVVLGTVKELVDSVALFCYFGAFSAWSFAYKMYSYGHNLSPEAPVKVPPFTPPLFGHQQIANFDVYSFPEAGTYLLVGAGLALFLALFLAWRERPRRLARAA
jgi:hypothetical protein